VSLGRWLQTQWDRVVAVGLVAAGIVALVCGWFGISHTPYPAEQLPYILSAGIGGLLLVSIGATSWLSADLRDEWRKLDAIDDTLHELVGSPLVDLDALLPQPERQASEASV